MDGPQLGILVCLSRLTRAVDIRGGHVHDAPDPRAARRRDYALHERRRALPELQPARRRPGLGAVEHDLDGADRVGHRLVVGVRVELDDRYVSRQRTRNLIAQKFPRADDEIHGARF